MCGKDHLIAYLKCLIAPRAVCLLFGLTLSNGEIGLSFLQGGLHPVNHCLHSFDFARHTPAVHENWWYKGVVARIEVEWTIPRSHIDSIICRKLRQCRVLTLGLGVSFDIRSQEIL